MFCDFWDSSVYGFPTPVPNPILKGAYQFCAREFKLNQKDMQHLHDFVQLWYVIKGKLRFHFTDSVINCAEGSLVILPPYCVHALDSENCGDIRCIYFNFTEEFISHAPENIHKQMLFNFVYPTALNPEQKAQPLLQFSSEEIPVSNLIIEGIYNTYINNKPDSRKIIYQNFEKLLSLPSLKFDEQTMNRADEYFLQYHRCIKSAMDYIKTHYRDTLRFHDVSRFSYMSERTFFSTFKKTTGLNFTDYVQNYRIRYAIQLLVYTDRTVLDIAAACGFKSGAHFNYVFRKLTKMTPKQLRSLR